MEGKFLGRLSWHEEDGVIYITLPPTDGTTGSEWIKRHEGKGLHLSKRAKALLSSPDFVPTSGVARKIAIIKGKLLPDEERFSENIRAKAGELELISSHPEVACQLRDLLSDEDIEAMGLWLIAIMHDPIKDSDGDLSLFDVHRFAGGHWLHAHPDRPNNMWYDSRGFAFEASSG